MNFNNFNCWNAQETVVRPVVDCSAFCGAVCGGLWFSDLPTLSSVKSNFRFRLWSIYFHGLVVQVCRIIWLDVSTTGE